MYVPAAVYDIWTLNVTLWCQADDYTKTYVQSVIISYNRLSFSENGDFTTHSDLYR